MWMFTDGGKSRKKNVSFLLILEIYIYFNHLLQLFFLLRVAEGLGSVR